MSKIIGFLMIVCGIVLGVYFGVVWAFIGGIVDVVTALKTEDIPAMAVALGAVKVVFSSTIGFFCATVLIIPGMAIAGMR